MGEQKETVDGLFIRIDYTFVGPHHDLESKWVGLGPPSMSSHQTTLRDKW